MRVLKLATSCSMVFYFLAFDPYSVGIAAELATSITAENDIPRLIERVAQSDCRFERNGQRYLSADAAHHLHRKWDNAKHQIGSAEMFIENIASKSSTSGKVYFIHCPNKEPETSQQWLLRELVNLRAQPK